MVQYLPIQNLPIALFENCIKKFYYELGMKCTTVIPATEKAEIRRIPSLRPAWTKIQDATCKIQQKRAGRVA
jgi:hypothetical protein